MPLRDIFIGFFAAGTNFSKAVVVSVVEFIKSLLSRIDAGFFDVLRLIIYRKRHRKYGPDYVAAISNKARLEASRYI